MSVPIAATTDAAVAAVSTPLSGQIHTDPYLSSMLFPASSAATPPRTFILPARSTSILTPLVTFTGPASTRASAPSPASAPTPLPPIATSIHASSTPRNNLLTATTDQITDQIPLTSAADPTPVIVRTPHITTLVHFSIPPAEGSVLAGNTETFHCFNKLPTELRHKIWKLAIPNRLLAVINMTKHYSNGTAERAIAVRQSLRTLSFVCHEAHTVTSKLYIQVHHDYLGWPLVYAPTADTFYFPGPPSNDPSNPNNLCICKFGNEVKKIGYPIPSIAFDEAVIGPQYTGRGFVWRDELILVVGKATSKSRTKVLLPGVKIPKGGGKWGQGGKGDLERRAGRIERLRDEMGLLLQREKALVKGAEMPVLKAMVVCEREAGVVWRRVGPAPAGRSY